MIDTFHLGDLLVNPERLVSCFFEMRNFVGCVFILKFVRGGIQLQWIYGLYFE